MAKPIDNYEDVIDSRDVIERIAELEALDQAEQQGGECMPDDMRDELKALQELARQGANYAPDWEYGEALIRDSYFEEYAQQLAEDCGMIQEGARWPYTCIDWEQAASELKVDYTPIDFDGVTYWIR